MLHDVNASSIAFNGDAGNMVSLRPEADAIGEVLQMLPNMRHCHIKDVVKLENEYRFPAIGQGLLDYSRLIPVLAAHEIPCTLEIPLRMHRLADSTPQRSSTPVPVDRIVNVLSESKRFIDSIRL